MNSRTKSQAAPCAAPPSDEPRDGDDGDDSLSTAKLTSTQKEDLITRARKKGSLVAAIAETKPTITLSQVIEARHEDPSFHTACQMVDEVTDRQIIQQVQMQACQGDIRSQTMYFRSIRPVLFPALPKTQAKAKSDAARTPGNPSPLPGFDELPSEVAEAMIQAGLQALGCPLATDEDFATEDFATEAAPATSDAPSDPDSQGESPESTGNHRDSPAVAPAAIDAPEVRIPVADEDRPPQDPHQHASPRAADRPPEPGPAPDSGRQPDGPAASARPATSGPRSSAPLAPPASGPRVTPLSGDRSPPAPGTVRASGDPRRPNRPTPATGGGDGQPPAPGPGPRPRPGPAPSPSRNGTTPQNPERDVWRPFDLR